MCKRQKRRDSFPHGRQYSTKYSPSIRPYPDRRFLRGKRDRFLVLQRGSHAHAGGRRQSPRQARGSNSGRFRPNRRHASHCHQHHLYPRRLHRNDGRGFENGQRRLRSSHGGDHALRFPVRGNDSEKHRPHEQRRIRAVCRLPDHVLPNHLKAFGDAVHVSGRFGQEGASQEARAAGRDRGRI